MELNKILHKTKKRGKSTTIRRKQINVPSRHRPYDLNPKVSKDNWTSNDPIKEEIEGKNIPLEQKTEQNLNLAQTKHKPGTNQTQTWHKPDTNQTQTRHKPGPIPGTQPDTNLAQTWHKKSRSKFAELIGNQRKILISLYKICKKNRDETTGFLTTSHISDISGVAVGSVKNSIKRLIKKELIEKIWSKKGGRGAVAQYKIFKDVYQDILMSMDSYFEHNQTQTWHKPGPIPGTQPGTNPLSSSSSNNNNKTTTTDLRSKVLDSAWEEIDFEPLTKIGFSNAHIHQLYQTEKTTAEIVQESIYHFAYALDHNDKYKEHQSPLNLILGVLRKGQVWIEQGYKSAQEIAQMKLLEQKTNEHERIKKLEEDAFHLAYTIWIEDELNDDQREEIISISKSKGSGKDIRPQTVKHREYFRENIWPEKKREYLVSVTKG